MGKYRVFRALFIRIVFIIHSILGVWQVTDLKNDKWFWYLCIPLFFLVFETVVTLSLRKNLEWNWYVLLNNVYFLQVSISNLLNSLKRGLF